MEYFTHPIKVEMVESNMFSGFVPQEEVTYLLFSPLDYGERGSVEEKVECEGSLVGVGFNCSVGVELEGGYSFWVL